MSLLPLKHDLKKGPNYLSFETEEGFFYKCRFLYVPLISVLLLSLTVLLHPLQQVFKVKTFLEWQSNNISIINSVTGHMYVIGVPFFVDQSLVK